MIQQFTATLIFLNTIFLISGSQAQALASENTQSHSSLDKQASTSETKQKNETYSDNEYSCKIADERRIAVIYDKKGSPLPCKVLYSKDPYSGKYVEIRRAKHEENNCETKAREVAKKFENAGWRCDHSLRSSANSNAAAISAKDHASPDNIMEPITSESPKKLPMDPIVTTSIALQPRNIYKFSLELDGRFQTGSKDVSYNDVTDKMEQSDLQLDLGFLRHFKRISAGPFISIVRSATKNSLTKSAYNSTVWGFGLATHYDFDALERTFFAPFIGLCASRDMAKATDKLFDLDVRSAESTIKISGQLGVKNPLLARLDLKAFINFEKIIYGRTEKLASVGSTSGAKINLGFGLAQYL